MELIKLQTTETGEQVVNGRDLHAFLEIGTPYNKWMPRMFEYGFIEGIDYVTSDKIVQRADGAVMPNAEKNHILTIDMAKQLCMLARNDKGMQARQYFIEIEKEWNSPERVMARALQIAEKKLDMQQLVIAQQTQQLAELQPKATYYDLILQNDSLLSTTQIAKDYGMSAYQLNKTLHDMKVQYKQSGQWFLYQKYAELGYTSSKTTVLDADKSVMHTYWTQKGRLFIYQLLKEQGILPLIERDLGE